MKVAFLILCHIDEKHIARVTQKLTECEHFDVYIHVDLKSDIRTFKNEIEENESVFFVRDRYDVHWGGYSAVLATMSLIKSASSHYKYDRYVIIQGLDYPLKTNEEIYNYFSENNNIEFIRGCNVTESDNKYFYSRCRYYLFYDRRNIIKKLWNKLSWTFDLKLKDGYVDDQNGKRYPVYWGSALWALTGECIEYILKFHSENPVYNKYFNHMFPADELYFATIVFNSPYYNKTVKNGPEKEKENIINWKLLHHYEYDEKGTKIFDESDYNTLTQTDKLFVKKVNTKSSETLLDLIDTFHS